MLDVVFTGENEGFDSNSHEISLDTTQCYNYYDMSQFRQGLGIGKKQSTNYRGVLNRELSAYKERTESLAPSYALGALLNSSKLSHFVAPDSLPLVSRSPPSGVLRRLSPRALGQALPTYSGRPSAYPIDQT